MKKNILFLLLLFMAFSLSAQKKVTAAGKSALLAMDIPADAKADNRFITKLGVDILINMKIRPMDLKLTSSEYFFWKGDKIKETRSAGIIDSLITGFTANSWMIAYDEKDDTVMWLMKDNKPFILMYITKNNQIDLYIGGLDKTPPVNFQ